MRYQITILLFILFSTCIMGGTENHGISINGTRVDKMVTEITYDENNITLHWNDNTSISNKIAQLMIKLASGDDNNIDKIKIASISGLYKNGLTIDGITLGSLLYIYDVQGNLIMQNQATSTSCELDISQLNTGIYLLKTSEEVIKFVKQ